MNNLRIKYKNFLFTLLLVVAGCEKPHTRVTFLFDLESLKNASAEVSFYIHDLYLINAEGQRLPVALTPGPWQNETVALIHLTSNANASQHQQIVGRVQKQGEFTALEFKLGVPFTHNHNYPLRAEAPLNNSNMFWSWQQGYKFLRIDVTGENHISQNSWSFHLGSTGCVSPSSLRPPVEVCQQENIATIQLPLKTTDTHSTNIQITLASLADLVEPQEQLICSGNYRQDEHCSAMLKNIGLNVETGACENLCRNQSLFSISAD